MQFNSKYTYEVRFGSPVHVWSTVTEKGGMHLHISDHGAEHAKKYGEQYSGGIEMHWRSPPDYMQGQPPSHDDCDLLHTPCWHDGSSLQVTDTWIPRWRASPDDHDRMFRLLESELEEQLAEPGDDGGAA